MAEWVQLRGGSTIQTGLERGHWYRVDTHTDGTIRVLGPEAVDAIPESVFRIITREPDFITRIQTAELLAIRAGSRMPDVSYYGVCPAGHHIKSVGQGDLRAMCPHCGHTYRIEDEQ
jgi:hypothetical protein